MFEPVYLTTLPQFMLASKQTYGIGLRDGPGDNFKGRWWINILCLHKDYFIWTLCGYLEKMSTCLMALQAKMLEQANTLTVGHTEIGRSLCPSPQSRRSRRINR